MIWTKIQSVALVFALAFLAYVTLSPPVAKSHGSNVITNGKVLDLAVDGLVNSPPIYISLEETQPAALIDSHYEVTSKSNHLDYDAIARGGPPASLDGLTFYDGLTYEHYGALLPGNGGHAIDFHVLKLACADLDTGPDVYRYYRPAFAPLSSAG